MNKYVFLIVLTFLSTLCDGQHTVGLIESQTGREAGYVLFAPSFSDTTYLIDKCGYRMHQWNSNYTPGLSAYLLEDGSLLRTGRIIGPGFNSGGKGGIIERFDWNGQLIWSYILCDATQCQHHDVRPLPNGNLLVLAWDSKSATEAISAGRDSSTFTNELWSEKIVEIQPIGSDSAHVVWEWHVWDHLIQSFDSTKTGFGQLNQHPELININYPPYQSGISDWLHCNSLDYNPALDQIIISSHNNCEFWIIDHSTTMQEAASHHGGRYGKGGDLLYRWGNPEAYDHGTVADRKLFGQHYPHWITNGKHDEGRIMVFNNGSGRPTGNYSSVDLIDPPLDSTGNYFTATNGTFGPDSACWSYTASLPTDFFAVNISGATRLDNGNTLVCSGPQGLFFEIDSLKNNVWQYINPTTQGSLIFSQGDIPYSNAVFRCTEYLPDYPAFDGKILVTGTPIELNPTSYACSMTPGVNELNDYRYWLTLYIDSEGQMGLKWYGNPDQFIAQVYNSSGQRILEIPTFELPGNESATLSFMTHLPSGIYLFSVSNGSLTWNFKFVR